MGLIQPSTEAKAASLDDSVVATLQALQDSDPDIQATAVVSVEGTLIASSQEHGPTDDRLAAMTAAMVGWGERIASELSRGQLAQVLIRGAAGSVILMPINDASVLSVMINDEMKLGLIFLDMRRAANDLADIMQVQSQ